MATKNTPVKKTPAVAGKKLSQLTPEESVKLKVRERTALFVDEGLSAIMDLCSFVSAGGHLAGYCQERGLKYHTVYDLIYSNPEYDQMYARSREARADTIADEIVSISDEQEVKANYNGEEVTLALDATAVARNRLRVDARKWAASKLKPRVYGDKVTQEHTGAGGGAIKVETMNLKHLSDTELEAMRTLMLKANGAA